MKKIDFTIKWLQWRLLRLRLFAWLKRTWSQKKNLRKILSGCLVVGVFLAKQSFDFTLPGTLILLYFGLSLVWRISSRLSALLALVFLASCPILLMAGQDALAETMAVQAYYLLVSTVVLQMLELKRGKETEWGEKAVWEKVLWGKNWLGKQARQIRALLGKRLAPIASWWGKKEQHLKATLLKRLVSVKKRPGKKEPLLVRLAAYYGAKERKATKSGRKKIAYTLLGAFLLLEIGIIFWDWSVLPGIFGYLAVVVLFFPRKALRILLPLGFVGLVLGLLFLLVSSRERADRLYDGAGVYVLALIVEAVVVGLWEQSGGGMEKGLDRKSKK